MGLAVRALYVYYGSICAALQDVIPAALRGTALALYFFAMDVLGASLGPYLAGLLSDHLTGRAAAAAGSGSLEAFRAEGLHAAHYVAPRLAVALAAVMVAAGRSAGAADIARVEAEATR